MNPAVRPDACANSMAPQIEAGWITYFEPYEEMHRRQHRRHAGRQASDGGDEGCAGCEPRSWCRRSRFKIEQDRLMTGKKWAYRGFCRGRDVRARHEARDGRRRSSNSPASSIRSRCISTRRPARPACSAGSPPRAGTRAHVHAHDVRRLPAQFDLAGLARHRLCEMEEAGAGRRHADRPRHGRSAPAARSRGRASASSTIRSELANQRGEKVFELQNTGMFLAREAAQ